MMRFNNYLNQIASTNSISELRELAQKIYNDKDLSPAQRKSLFEVYRQKLQLLYREKVDNSQNKIFKNLYWLIKKHPCPEVGMLIYELKDTDLLDKEERQILFEEYERKKYLIEEKSAEEENKDNNQDNNQEAEPAESNNNNTEDNDDIPDF